MSAEYQTVDRLPAFSWPFVILSVPTLFSVAITGCGMAIMNIPSTIPASTMVSLYWTSLIIITFFNAWYIFFYRIRPRVYSEQHYTFITICCMLITLHAGIGLMLFAKWRYNHQNYEQFLGHYDINAVSTPVLAMHSDYMSIAQTLMSIEMLVCFVWIMALYRETVPIIKEPQAS